MKVKKTKFDRDLKVPAYLFYDGLEANELRLQVIKGNQKQKKLEKAFTKIFDL